MKLDTAVMKQKETGSTSARWRSRRIGELWREISKKTNKIVNRGGIKVYKTIDIGCKRDHHTSCRVGNCNLRFKATLNKYK